MTLVELKKSIHEKIDDLDDQKFLEYVAAIIDNNKGVFIVPEHMKNGILKGQDDINNGRIHTTEDFEKKYEKWLKE